MALTRSVLKAAIVAAGLVLVWIVLGAILSNDRGLDITDEGLYLLAADPPDLQAAWLVPWGWHTRPLLWVVGNDVAAFRTLGAVILSLSGLGLGMSAARLTRMPRAAVMLTAATGFVGSLLFYSGFLRSPGYNWVNAVGLTIAACGWLQLIAICREPDGRALHKYLAAAAAALGMTFAVVAKPTSPLLLLVLGVALMWILTNWRTTLVWGLRIIAMCVGWVVLAVGSHIWPVDCASVFLQAAGMPVLSDRQSVLGAGLAALSLPVEFVRSVWSTAPVLLVVALTGIVVSAIPLVLRRSWASLRLVGVGVTAVAACAMAMPIDFLRGDGPLVLWSSGVLCGLVLLLIAALLSAGRATWRRETFVVLYLVLLPFLFVFGSSVRLLAIGSLFAAPVLVAVTLALHPVGSGWRAWGGTAVVCALCIGMTVGLMAFSRAYPYRSPSINADTEVTPIGAHGASLLMSRDLSEVIIALRETPDWTSDTPTVGLLWRWSSGIPYAMGAKVPQSLMPTLFGYPASIDVARFHFAAPAGDFVYADAWLLTTPTSQLGPLARRQVGAVVTDLEVVSGRQFPADYVCQRQVAFVQVWKPRADGSEGVADLAKAEAACPEVGPSD